MNTSTQQKIYYSLGAIIIVLAIIWIVLASRKSTTPAAPETAMSTSTDMSMSTSTVSAPEAPTLTMGPNIGYSLVLASSTYSQNDRIPMTLTIYNLSDIPQNFSFKDGCEATYSIAGFNELPHILCKPNPTMFTLSGHGVVQIPLMHYPLIYKIPVGTHTITATLIGYGSASKTVTITQ